MSLLAPRGGTSVLVKASDEPWLTAHATSLTVISPGSRLERKDDGWSRADAPGAAATPWAGFAACTRRCELPAAWSKVVACVPAKAGQAGSEDTQP